MANPILTALRKNDWQKLKDVEDIKLIDLEMYYEETLRDVSKSSNVESEPMIVPENLEKSNNDIAINPKRGTRTKKYIKFSDWINLPQNDLRYIIAQGKIDGMTHVEILKQKGILKAIDDL